MTNFTQKKFQNYNLLSLSLGARKNFLSLSILFIALFWGQLATAQRNIIPIADGSFSNATQLPANNGWTATFTSTARDAWCVSGNPTQTTYTSPCAHLSNSWNGAKAYTYLSGSSSRNHLYRSINLSLYPKETIITLSFKWYCIGNANDRMRVYLLSSGTPTQGAAVATTEPTAYWVGPSVNYSGSGANWATTTVTLPSSYAGQTFILDFEWVNNGDTTVNQPPAAIDDVTLTTRLPNDNCAGINANSTLTVNPSTTCVGGTSITEDTTSATLSQAGCAGTADDDVWFQFTAAATSHTITVTPGTMADPVFQVFSDCGTTSLACINTPATTETTTLTGLIIGNIYYVRVHSLASATGQGTFSICVTTPPCVAPSSQASAFTLGTITSTSIAASFTGVASANGYLVLRSTTNTAPTQPTDGAIYNAGNTQVGYTFIQTGTALTISDSGLTENTRYYYFIYAYNNTGCTGGPVYNTAGALVGNGITCPSFPSSVTTASITNTSFILNWAAPLLGGSAAAITYTVQVTTDAGYTVNIVGSPFTGIAGLTTTISGLSQSTMYYYRILANNGCSSSYVGSSVTTLATCVAPASQAGSFALGTLTSTSVPASFTATAADGYLVIQSTSVTAPTQPVNGTTYTSGNVGTLGGSLTFIQSSASTAIAGTGLTGNTRYYYFIYAYNNTGCGGGPVYNAAGALTGNGVTCPAVPNSVTTSGVNANDFTLNWTAPTGGSASVITYTVQVTTDAGYSTNIAGSPFTGIAALTYNVTGLTGSTLYYYRVLATNGCSSAYVSSSVTTATPITFCTPPSSNCALTNPSDMDMITNVTLNSLNNSSACSAAGYISYAATGSQTTSLLKGSTYTFSLSVGTGTGTHGAAVWFDFNQNGLFTDAGEYFLIGNSITPSTTTTASITIPVGANSGGVRMRVRYLFNITVTSASSCTIATYGETEDYTVTLVAPAGCATPTAQPTVLSLTPVNTTINGSFTAASPVPDTYLVVVSTSNTAPSPGPVNGTSYAIGGTVVAGYTVVDTDSNTTFSATGLSANTLHYFYVYSMNSLCTGGPIYVTASPLTGSATTGTALACTPTGNLNCATLNDFITNVTINTLNNTTTCGAGGYTVYPATGTQTTTLIKGTSYNFNISVDSGIGTHGAGVWFDFNQNGLFTDAGEFFLISNAILPNTTTTVSIAIPAGANGGSVAMRVRYAYGITVTAAMSCTMLGTYGETEDYTVNIVPAVVCVTPTAQPTVLSLTPVSTTINGSFTAASPTPDSYLVIVSTSNTPPSPSNGSTYAIGGTVGAGYTVVDTDNNTTFSASGLAGTTLYYVYVYAMNSICTGGPLYLTTSPLTGSATTGAAVFCTPTGNLDCASFNNSIYNVTINTLNNSSTCGAGGYTNYAATGSQTTTLFKGGAYNLTLGSGPGAGTHGAAVWFDFNQNGSFADAGEYFLISNAISPTTTTTASIIVPVGANTGAIRMRVRYAYGITVTSAMSCTMGGVWGETEDYTVTLTIPTACNATTLNCGDTNIPGTTLGSSNYFANGTGCTLSDYGTWFTFVGDGQQTTITSTGLAGFDHEMAIASGSCGSLTNITCVDQFINLESYSLNTTAGVTYYVYIAYYNAGATTGAFTITRSCSPPYFPCSSIPTITCGATTSVTIPSGIGNFPVSSCNYIDDGKEQLYTFTPATTGSYYISQTAGYTFNDYQFKLVSSGCSSGGWTCISNLSGLSTSSAFTLTGGLAYYILIDPSTTTGGTITFTIGNKLWTGTTNTNWNTATNWLPNTTVPNATDCVIIPNTTNKPIVSGASYNGLAGTLTLLPSAQLTVNATNSVTVTDKVTNTGGTFTLNNNTSLIQVNNVTNSGDIVYKRDATVKLNDYVYWSSPVSNYVLNAIASPLAFPGMYKWVIPGSMAVNSNGGQGSWVYCGGETMIAGKGYIARVPNSFTAAPSTFNGTFTGVPNNGNISFPIERGDILTTPNGVFPAAPFAGNNGQPISNLTDNWNLVGNPYPSAISGGQFLINNNTKIAGTIRLWLHGISPSSALLANPYYTSYSMNYNPADYLTWNFSGSSCCPAGTDIYIGAGQGFFIQMLDGPRASDNVTFNNGLRSAGYDNSVFYRPSTNHSAQSPLNIENLERNRIWLDILDGGNNTNRTLFGYIEGATMGNDNYFDAVTNNHSATQIYSLTDNLKFLIQGRALPFNVQDEVPIGVDIKAAGNCSIGIGAVDGLFDTQDIYLIDNLLNITHDLKASPYQFTAAVGIIDTRFKVVYVNNALENPSFELDNNVKVLVNNELVAVSSNDFLMESVEVYNVLGQKLNTYSNINANYITLAGLHKNNTTLLLKIKLQTGEIVTRKVSY